MTSTEKLGSFNDYIAEHPDAQVADYTSELATYRTRIAGLAGVTPERLHHFPDIELDQTEETSTV